jgi:hypothetical protein
MSEVFDGATVSLLMSDFAVADQLGKLQVVGGGLQTLTRDHNTGTTTAFAVTVGQSFPSALGGEQYVFELVLEDSAGKPVELPAAPAGAVSSVIRFGQTMQVEEPNVRGTGVARHAIPARSQVVVYFNTGLPLATGQVYTWRARIDGESKPEWTWVFVVPAPPAGPVLG